MSKSAKDPEKRSRLLRAAAIAALLSAFLGGLVVFGWYEGSSPFDWDQAKKALAIAMSITAVVFWILFLVLYFATVRKSRSALEFEQYVRLEEQKRVERAKAGLNKRA